MDRLLSIPEAAKYLGGISSWTVRKMLKTGQLGRTKVGSRTMIRESQLQRVIKDEFTSDAEHPSASIREDQGASKNG